MKGRQSAVVGRSTASGRSARERALPLLRLAVLAAVASTALGGFLQAAPRGHAALSAQAAATADAGFRDFSFGSSASAPTAKDQQSKLWFNDGTWWGSLFNASTLKFHIFRLNAATQTWSDTGTVIDERDRSRSDTFSDGTRLYVVTHGTTAATSTDRIRLLRFSYVSATKTYTQDTGYPVDLNTAGTAAATIDKDSTGMLWMTYTQGSKVWVSHSTTSDSTWVTPYVLPVSSTTNLLDQDESAIVSYNGKIGIMWGNQNTSEWAYYFATHVDGSADNAWTRTTAVQATEESDNHLNLKALDGDPAGQVFAAVKTSLNAADAPLYYLLVLRNDGTWVKHTFGTVADDHTRAQVALDPVNRRLYMFGTSPCCSGGSIYYKDTSLDAPSFAAGKGTPLIQNPTDTHINNPSTTKQSLTTETGLVVEASDDTSKFYVHATLNTGPDVTPPDTTINSGPSGTVGSSSASFTFSANEGGSTFECSLDGVAFASCTSPKAYTGLADGSHTFQVRATDPVGNVDPSPASRTWTLDTSTQILTFPAVADSFVEAAKPTTNFGTNASLVADDSPNTESFIRFAPSGVPGTVIEAKLRLFVANGTNNGPALYRTDATWSETGVTWNTRPATVGGVIEDKGAIQNRTWAEYDVNPVVTGNGTYSFRLDPTSTDGVDFYSRDSTNANKPQLVLTVDNDTIAPETTIDTGPTGTVKTTSATFTFSSNEPSAGFSCSLDGSPYTSCSSPQTYSGLAEGSHIFGVRAVDAAGNLDPTPASRGWSIDSTAPAAPVITSPADNSANTTGSITVAGTAQPGTSVQILDGATLAATTTADGAAGWSVTLTDVADGSHTYTARATDAAGNTSPPSNATTVTVDSTAPDTTIDSGPSGTTSSTSASFTFSSDEPGSTFQCSLDTGAYASCTSPQTYDDLGEGSHSFDVRATDAAGNSDATPAGRTWAVDSIAPAAPVIVSPTDNSTSTTGSITVSGSVEPGVTVEVYDGAASAGATTADGAGAWSLTLTGVSDGSHTYSAKAMDAAENVSASSNVRTVTVNVDTGAPETTIDSGPSGNETSSSATFVFSASEAGSSFECSLDAGGFAACVSPTTYGSLSEGSHSLSVRATDAAGNVDASPAMRTWTVDATVPTVMAVFPTEAATDVLVNSNITAIFSEAMDGASITTSTFTLVVQSTGTAIVAHVAYDAASRTATLNPDAPLVPATAYAATVVGGASGVRDLAGSGLAADKAWSFTTEAVPDTTPPETTIVSGPSGPTASSSATFTFSSDEAGSTFQCRLDGGVFASCTSPHSFSGLAEGSHTFSVRATDDAGNVDPTPATQTWTVDTVAPVAPSIVNPPDGSTNSSGNVTISGSAEQDSAVEVFDGATAKGTTTASGAGSWSLVLTGVGDGSHVYTAKARDAAGNTSPSSNSRTVTVDATAPETTIDSGPSGTTTSTSASFTFSSNEAGATFACSLDGAAFAGCASPQSYSSLGEGSHTFAVRAADALGNIDATPASRSWTISLALFSDGFESGTFSAWTQLLTGGDGTAVVQSTTVKSGVFSAQLFETSAAGSFAYARKQLDQARTELRVRGDFRIETEGVSGGNVPLVRLFDTAGTRIVSLYRQNLDVDKIRVTHSGVGLTTTGRLPLNTWGLFELHVIVAGAGASTVEVFQNGILVYQTTTASLGTNPVLTVQIGNETKAQAFKLFADDITVRP